MTNHSEYRAVHGSRKYGLRYINSLPSDIAKPYCDSGLTHINKHMRRLRFFFIRGLNGKEAFGLCVHTVNQRKCAKVFGWILTLERTLYYFELTIIFSIRKAIKCKRKHKPEHGTGKGIRHHKHHNRVDVSDRNSIYKILRES